MNIQNAIGDHKRLATNTFWIRLLEEMDIEQSIHARGIAAASGSTIEELRYDQGRNHQMGREVFEKFVNKVLEKIKSG